MALVSKAGSFYYIRSDITRGRTGQNVAFGVVNNVEASIMREKSVNFTSLTCKNARVAQFFPLETVGFRSKRRNSVIVAATPPTKDALIATELLTKQDLVGYLASGCLPDAVALRCLARVPFYLYPKLELVSRSWRAAIRGSELFKARQEVGSAEELLCVCAYDPENLWQMYDPLRDLWITLPVLPSKVRHLAYFGVVSTGGKLYVLGGGSDDVDPLTGDQDGSFATDEVWSYDPIMRRWAQRASMVLPRAMFACCVSKGKIIVAGGFTSCRKSISQAEMYDPEKDVWIPIPDLHRTHNSACSGLVIGGKVYVLHKGLSTVQVLDHIGSGWTVEDYGWLQGPMAVVQGALYVMSHGLIVKQEKEVSKVVISASEFRRRIGFAMTGLRDEIYVIGGVIGPDRFNWDIKPMSDVDILTVGGNRPTWRQAASMTKCRGTIFGCTQLRI